jgi:hypothetical protein
VLLERLFDELSSLARNAFASIIALAVGILVLYLIASNAEGIGKFLLNSN